ncbi:MAG: pseudouridylate synthase family protein [Rickettsiales bacterium]|jgi:23S rRNA pseudouridine2605 synthase|nr:pseudouridylate synthase family protein [Rickettsiales bacterium]
MDHTHIEEDETPDDRNGPGTGERIAKFLSRSGICSRREAERWIEEGRVEVDRKVLTTPATFVTSAQEIRVDGERIAQKEGTRLWLFYKPKSIITTARDPQARKTVFDILPEHMPRVMTVGRLDFNTEGLLLLTNDGELSRYLELPETGWKRRYRVRVYGRATQAQLEPLKAGITVEGVHYAPMEVTFDSNQGSNSWLTVVLTEGKNREIRRVMEHVGLQVNRLLRVSYGAFQLGSLKEGEVKEVSHKVLKEQLGKFFENTRNS